MTIRTSSLIPTRFYTYDRAQAIADGANSHKSYIADWNYFVVDGLEDGNCNASHGDAHWYVAVLDSQFNQLGTL